MIGGTCLGLEAVDGVEAHITALAHRDVLQELGAGPAQGVVIPRKHILRDVEGPATVGSLGHSDSGPLRVIPSIMDSAVSITFRWMVCYAFRYYCTENPATCLLLPAKMPSTISMHCTRLKSLFLEA